MRHTGDIPEASSRIDHPQASKGFSYENLAHSLAAKMRGLLRSTEPRRLSPPFQVVIMSHHGNVLFECEVNESGRVVHGDAPRQVRRSHFPATVFFTDRSKITRTFQIERGLK